MQRVQAIHRAIRGWRKASDLIPRIRCGEFSARCAAWKSQLMREEFSVGHFQHSPGKFVKHFNGMFSEPDREFEYILDRHE